MRSQLYGRELDTAAGRVHADDLDGHRIADPDPALGAGAHARGLEGVELPPVPAQPADRKPALVAVAEGHEGARADPGGAPPRELPFPSVLEEQLLEQE